MNLLSKKSSNQIELIKWIAIITMLIDHIGMIFLKDYHILRDIGRVSFPLFAYLLIHNYIYFTSNKKKYIKRLAIFALISAPPFYLYINYELNIFFTLFSSIGIIYIVENLFQKKDIEKIIISFMSFLFLGIFINFMEYKVIGFILLISLYMSMKSFSNLKYIWYGIGLMSLFLLNFETEYKWGLAFSSMLSILILYFVSKYNLGLNIRVNKYIFYLFYPIQFIIFYIIQNFML